MRTRSRDYSIPTPVTPAPVPSTSAAASSSLLRRLNPEERKKNIKTWNVWFYKLVDKYLFVS